MRLTTWWPPPSENYLRLQRIKGWVKTGQNCGCLYKCVIEQFSEYKSLIFTMDQQCDLHKPPPPIDQKTRNLLKCNLDFSTHCKQFGAILRLPHITLSANAGLWLLRGLPRGCPAITRQSMGVWRLLWNGDWKIEKFMKLEQLLFHNETPIAPGYYQFRVLNLWQP